MPIDQHQAAAFTKSSKIDRRLPGGTIIDVFTVARDGDWQVAENAFDVRILL